jgi:hypothetical protein
MISFETFPSKFLVFQTGLPPGMLCLRRLQTPAEHRRGVWHSREQSPLQSTLHGNP